jgi:ubiquinone/menaquinone biosynthesis C-methylase UbiE
MTVLSEDKVPGFVNPTQNPSNEDEYNDWVKLNQNWWEKHPMVYNWDERIPYDEFTIDFYREVDRRFFTEANIILPFKNIPFERLINFSKLRDKKVLEIGIGNGSHAQLIAHYCKHFTGIDLTQYATKSTRERMNLFKISNAQIFQMNAEKMSFSDNAFDFVWSWGVIHHSANPKMILSEINRVLVKGGGFTAMVYHRGYWNYYLKGIITGLVQGNLRDGLHKIRQINTDGAIARFYKIREWKKLLKENNFKIKRIQILGLKTEINPIPNNRFQSIFMSLIPDRMTRFCINNLRMGSYLVSEVIKK